MEHHDFRFSYTRYPDASQLTSEDQTLIRGAIKACDSAYAPYSNFRVGVAIRTVENQMVLGSNQENGAYPIGQCAERVALYQLVHTYGRKPVDTIAIAVDHKDQQSPASPCGSCRQILNEYRSFQTTPIRLLLTLVRSEEVIEIQDVTDLLPLSFDGKFLGQ
jgi:cytidine deaminase